MNWWPTEEPGGSAHAGGHEGVCPMDRAAAETGPDGEKKQAQEAGSKVPSALVCGINNTDVHFMLIETKEATLENVLQQQCFIPIH